jgi:hypothetical protein
MKREHTEKIYSVESAVELRDLQLPCYIHEFPSRCANNCAIGVQSATGRQTDGDMLVRGYYGKSDKGGAVGTTHDAMIA